MFFIRLLIIYLFLGITIFAQSDSLSKNDKLYPPINSIEKVQSLIVYNPEPIYSWDWDIDTTNTWNSYNVNSYVIRQYEPLKTKLNYTTLAGVGAATLGVGIAVHLYQQNAWWAGEKVPFHFQNDPAYALNIDKAGHFFGGALIAHLFSGAFEAGNMQSEDAAIWGSSLSFAFQMYVEIEDGFGPQWGFSPGDAAADFLGAGFTLGQYYWPFLKNFQPKFSYFPSKEYREGKHKGNAIDDYNGQKFWLSMRVRNFLPDNISNYWPEWLNIAVGAGVNNVDSPNPVQRNLYIALDFDWESLPLYGRVWQFVKNSFNYVHLPMPGIRINNKAAVFVFLF